MKIIIVANAQTKGDTLSGSDRIFIELAKRWAQSGNQIQIITCSEGLTMCQRSGLTNVLFFDASIKYKLPLYFTYILRILKGSFILNKIATNDCIVYSSSDFWPDALPAWFLKFRSGAKWVAGFYLFAPSLNRNSPYKGQRRIRALVYYFSQMPVFAIIRRFADMVWVTSEPDISIFTNKHRAASKVIAVKGGVDFKTAQNFCAGSQKIYDAIFIGRFHPQKGVLELVDIWRSVCREIPTAKLALIGVGDLEQELRIKVRQLGLEGNITFFGFKDGLEKLSIVRQSKIVLHPAIYDSGGMAACEAMACGLPGVSFDLPALKTYYPKGLIKTRCYDLRAFADNILKLMNDEELYKKNRQDALDLAKEWDWDLRAEKLLDVIKNLSELPDVH